MTEPGGSAPGRRGPSTPSGGAGRAARALVVGVGCSLGCPGDELDALVADSLAGIDGAVGAVATIDRRAHEPCVLALAARLDRPLCVHPAAALAVVAVPTPSSAVDRHVGTPSVAEAAALLSAGPGARLVVAKRRSPHATCAIAAASGDRDAPGAARREPAGAA